MIYAIVAVDNDYGIGFKGQLLEHIPEDLKMFKKLTKDNTVIMGNNTWISLPVKPLPQRTNIVITRNKLEDTDDIKYMSLDEAKEYALNNEKDEEIFIIGGGMIYKEFLPICDYVFLTKIFTAHENIDTYFPNLDLMSNWECIEKGEISTYKDISYQFQLYRNNY